MRARFLLPALVAAVVSLGAATGVAHADPSSQDIAQARDLGGQAKDAFDAGNYAESEKLWSAAQALYPAPTLTLGLARTQAKLGKLVSASESYNRIIREQGDKTNLSGAFKDALEAAKAEIGAVQARIGSVVITIEGPSNPTVTLDGQPISSAALGLKRPIDPGPHTLKAEAPGYKPGETTFQVADAGSADSKLVLEKSGDGVAVTAPPPVNPDQGNLPPPASKDGGNSNKTFAFVAWGVGGAGLVFGAITGIVAIGKHGDLSDKCPGGKCPSSAQSDIDSYKTMGTLSTVGFIVAGVGAAAGAILWFTGKNGSASASTSSAKSVPEWHPYLGAGNAGVVGTF